VDGNKRIALVLTDVFLALNGWDLQDSPEHVEYVLKVCTGQLGLADSADHLNRHSVRADGAEDDVIELDRP
jgi:prophage maintenance system killer protein